jgi:hypothetical protein
LLNHLVYSDTNGMMSLTAVSLVRTILTAESLAYPAEAGK